MTIKSFRDLRVWQTGMDLVRLKYLPPEQVSQVLAQMVSLSKQLYALRNALTKSNKASG